MYKRIRFAPGLLIGMILLSGCGALFPASLPTPLPAEYIGTAIVETSAVLASQTALHAPTATETLLPSRTPFPTETRRPTQTASTTLSPTNTFVVRVISYFTPPTPTRYLSPTPYEPGFTPKPAATATRVGGATLWDQKPKTGTVFAPGTPFDAYVVVSNDTRIKWDKHEVDFIYLYGDKFFAKTQQIIDLPATTEPGKTIKIPVKMVAPMAPGRYSMSYLLHEGDRYYIIVTWYITVMIP